MSKNRGYLRRFIADRSLQPGDRLPSIRQLAESLQISQAAARDLFVQAQAEGLVEIRSRSGAVVRCESRELDGLRSEAWAQPFALQVVDGHQLYLCQARELIEVQLAGMAARRCRPEDLLPVRQALAAWLDARATGDDRGAFEADCRFHLGIAEMAGNPVMASMLDQCLGQQRMWECSRPERAEDHRRIVAIHQEIYDALCQRDPERAQNAMTQHMRHLEHNIELLLADIPGKNASPSVEFSQSQAPESSMVSP